MSTRNPHETDLTLPVIILTIAGVIVYAAYSFSTLKTSTSSRAALHKQSATPVCEGKPPTGTFKQDCGACKPDNTCKTGLTPYIEVTGTHTGSCYCLLTPPSSGGGTTQPISSPSPTTTTTTTNPTPTSLPQGTSSTKPLKEGEFDFTSLPVVKEHDICFKNSAQIGRCEAGTSCYTGSLLDDGLCISNFEIYQSEATQFTGEIWPSDLSRTGGKILYSYAPTDYGLGTAMGYVVRDNTEITPFSISIKDLVPGGVFAGDRTADSLYYEYSLTYYCGNEGDKLINAHNTINENIWFNLGDTLEINPGCASAFLESTPFIRNSNFSNKPDSSHKVKLNYFTYRLFRRLPGSSDVESVYGDALGEHVFAYYKVDEKYTAAFYFHNDTYIPQFFIASVGVPFLYVYPQWNGPEDGSYHQIRSYIQNTTDKRFTGNMVTMSVTNERTLGGISDLSTEAINKNEFTCPLTTGGFVYYRGCAGNNDLLYQCDYIGNKMAFNSIGISKKETCSFITPISSPSDLGFPPNKTYVPPSVYCPVSTTLSDAKRNKWIVSKNVSTLFSSFPGEKSNLLLPLNSCLYLPPSHKVGTKVTVGQSFKCVPDQNAAQKGKTYAVVPVSPSQCTTYHPSFPAPASVGINKRK